MSYALPLSMTEPDDREREPTRFEVLEFIREDANWCNRMEALVVAIVERDGTPKQLFERADSFWDGAAEALIERRRERS